MDARSIIKLGALGVLVMTFVAGCPSVQPENAITWGLKASTNQLTQTTPTEWQAIVSKINDLTPDANVSLSDDEATAIVDFVQANDLNSMQEIAQLVEDAQSDPNSVSDIEIPDSVIGLFQDADMAAVLDSFLSGL